MWTPFEETLLAMVDQEKAPFEDELWLDELEKSHFEAVERYQ